jgi:hypothetical protein
MESEPNLDQRARILVNLARVWSIFPECSFGEMLGTIIKPPARVLSQSDDALEFKLKCMTDIIDLAMEAGIRNKYVNEDELRLVREKE